MIFGRKVAVELGVPGAISRRIEGLRVAFVVEHTDGSEPNHAEIIIYNASPETISEITKEGAVVRLFAGYDSARLVFEGTPITNGVRSTRSGVDRILQIEALDGGRDYRRAVIQVNFSGSATAQEVVDAAFDALGLPVGKIEASGDYPNGLTFSGAASELLDRVARVSGARWFIRSGALFFLPADSATGETAPVVSVANGNLIGTPTQTDDGVEVRALLDASIQQGRAVRVESDGFSGDFRVRRVKVIGDSGWDTPFYSEFLAAPL